MSRTVGFVANNAARTMSASTPGSKINPKELFVGSDLSERYAKYRPKLPVEHVKTIVELLGRRPEVWLDVGCGPGTSTQQIIGHTDKLVGIDVSDTQVAVANKTIQHPSLSFVQGSCEKLPAEDCSVDVITAVQAAHYFDLPAFFKEVDRVLKPGGIVGLVCINLPTCVDSSSMHNASTCIWDVIAQYGMPNKVKLVLDNYKDFVLPYPTRKDYMFDIRTSWSLRDYLDECLTSSPVNNMIKSLGLSMEEGYDHVTELMKDRGMTEVDMKSLYTWSHSCPLVTASKPLN